MVLREGKNRQIRRIVEQMGFRVIRLHRSAIGPINLHPVNQDPLDFGEYRFLNPFEQRFLQDHLKLATGK